MDFSEILKAFPALGGAGAMLIVSRFVWGISVDELARLRKQIHRVEAERDHYAYAASAYRRVLVSNGVPLPEVPDLPEPKEEDKIK